MNYPKSIRAYEAYRKHNKILVVMFVNDACDCATVLSDMETLANADTRASFVYISVDKFTTLQDAKGLTKFPTFKIYKNKQLTSTIVRAHDRVATTVEKLAFE